MTEFTQNEENIIQQAISIIEERAEKYDIPMTNASCVKEYCRLQIGSEKREVFAAIFLNNQNHLIRFEVLFTGGVNSANVFSQVVARRSLELNAVSCIFVHNHPGGLLMESSPDVTITNRLIDALRLFDIKVLDHIIVTPLGSVSFAEKGLI